MLKDIILLGIGGVFGLGATMMAAAAPSYINLPHWVWHWLFWGGLVLMMLMIGDAVILLIGGNKFLRIGPAALANGAIFAFGSAIIWQTAPFDIMPKIQLVTESGTSNSSPNRPILSLIRVGFPEGRQLSPGTLVIEWAVINTGQTSAKIIEEKATPILLASPKGTTLETFQGRLPEKPIYGSTNRFVTGQILNPNVPSAFLTPTSMELTQEQVDAINAGSSRLYFYGYIKYGQDSEFAFIACYEPAAPGRPAVFIKADQDYPSYSRAE